MTVKEFLETGYGIDFSTLDFKTTEGSSTKEEVLKSLETNEIRFESIDDCEYPATDVDIHDNLETTVFYVD